MAEGTYGYGAKTYFSIQKPQGTEQDFTPDTYDYDLSTRFMEVERYVDTQAYLKSKGQPYDDSETQRQYVIPIQEELLAMGYLDTKNEVDGYIGPKTSGAMRRYLLNAPSITEEAWHTIKSFAKDLFEFRNSFTIPKNNIFESKLAIFISSLGLSDGATGKDVLNIAPNFNALRKMCNQDINS